MVVSHLLPTELSTPVLSKREIEVLLLVAQGLASKEIARQMGVSIRTVHSHLASLFAKLKVSSRTQAVLLAVHQGLISLQDTYGT
jgi:DNA-binding CsgD family transcriptional regulator